ANFRRRDISALCRAFILDRPSGWREVTLRAGASEFVLDLRESATNFSIFVHGPALLWEANGHFVHRGGGKIELLGRQPEFELLTTGQPTPKINTYLSLFRDATGTVVSRYDPGKVPPGDWQAVGSNPWKFNNLGGVH